MNTFAPGYAPVTGTEAQFDARVITNKFGDGYRQTSADGLNATATTIALSWTSIPIVAAQNMHNFLAGSVGQPFYYTLPRETTPRIFDCTSWKRGWPAGGYDSFSATFVERFDIVS